VVVVYLTGIGAVDNPVPTAAAAPFDRLSRAVAPASATIGGAAAHLDFLGLVPGFVGLSQANLVVPRLPSGDHPVVIKMGSVQSNAPLLSIK
jgi:uncharacterized protein (TIGR03437 family)